MNPSPSDPALYSKIVDGKLVGLASTQVDGIVGAGSDSFSKASALLEEKFESKPRTRPPLFFVGVNITPEQGGDNRLEQRSYYRHLETLPPDPSFDQVRSSRHAVCLDGTDTTGTGGGGVYMFAHEVIHLCAFPRQNDQQLGFQGSWYTQPGAPYAPALSSKDNRCCIDRGVIRQQCGSQYATGIAHRSNG